jgi:hypothetical protein
MKIFGAMCYRKYLNEFYVQETLVRFEATQWFKLLETFRS